MVRGWQALIILSGGDSPRILKSGENRARGDGAVWETAYMPVWFWMVPLLGSDDSKGGGYVTLLSLELPRVCMALKVHVYSDF